jgi:thiamine biosynthesis lipoprotein
VTIKRIEHLMGTVVGIDVRDAKADAAVVAAAFDRIVEIEARFSPFRPDSELSRVIRGEIAQDDTGEELREVFHLCETVRLASDGYFDIRAHRPDGAPDPSGLVKGWAVEEAASILDAGGARSYAINAGGDIVARGEPAPGEPWRIGIQHPRIRDRVAAVLSIRDLAVATSGAYERGEHVIDPHLQRPPTGVLSATVVGPSLTFADAYATAALAMGTDGIAWIATLRGYAGCVITDDDRFIWTEALEPFLNRVRGGGIAGRGDRPTGGSRPGLPTGSHPA